MFVKVDRTKLTYYTMMTILDCTIQLLTIALRDLLYGKKYVQNIACQYSKSSTVLQPSGPLTASDFAKAHGQGEFVVWRSCSLFE